MEFRCHEGLQAIDAVSRSSDELGAEDLKELGVPLGDCKRLLKAIADLRMSLESASEAETGAAARGPPIPRVDPERRQLTLLFCDLVAFTYLAPDIVEAILDGRQPKGLRLAEMLGNAPFAWNEQRADWGLGSVATAMRAEGS